MKPVNFCARRAGEYGVTTGRKRRCGWFDAVQARYAVEVNSMTDMALTKLDVLSCVPRIKVCVAYEADGQRYDYFPMQHSVIYPKNVTPIYEELPGWEGVDISDCKKFEDLPANAQSYVKYLEEVSGCKGVHHRCWSRSQPDYLQWLGEPLTIWASPSKAKQAKHLRGITCGGAFWHQTRKV